MSTVSSLMQGSAMPLLGQAVGAGTQGHLHRLFGVPNATAIRAGEMSSIGFGLVRDSLAR
jgi:hypothetical protein